MARPEKPLKWEEVDSFLESKCAGTVIAAHFNMHPNTFYRKVEEEHKMSFSEYCSLKNEYGEALIKRAQFEKAIGRSKKGDTTLLTFLGRVRLKQIEYEPEKNLDLPTREEILIRDDEILKLKDKNRQLEYALKSQAGTELHRSNSPI
jgi:hypothetical protein